MTGIVASAFSNQLSRKKAAYHSQLRQVLSDGVVSDAERESLRLLQIKYRLTDAQVQAAMDEAKIGKNP
jgi:voltage-gated potassium channel